RFKPIEVGRAGDGDGGSGGGQRAAAQGAPGQGGAARGMRGAAQAMGDAARPQRRQQTVYVVAADNSVKPVAVRTGISDGRFTAITDGELKVGDKIGVGFQTAKADVQGSSPVGGRGPGGGGGRRF